MSGAHQSSAGSKGTPWEVHEEEPWHGDGRVGKGELWQLSGPLRASGMNPGDTQGLHLPPSLLESHMESAWQPPALGSTGRGRLIGYCDPCPGRSSAHGAPCWGSMDRWPCVSLLYLGLFEPPKPRDEVLMCRQRADDVSAVLTREPGPGEPSLSAQLDDRREATARPAVGREALGVLTSSKRVLAIPQDSE